jgi:putative glutathione S-transferase
MGILADGKWVDDEKDLYHGRKGQFKRPESPVRHWVTTDGSAGPTGDAGFKAEPGRYHLYVAINCPWAHRTIIYRMLKKLEGVISISYARPTRGDEGWIFDNDSEAHRDHLFNATYLHEVYTRSHPDYTGRVSVPMLWDKSLDVMVNNESSEIIRMLNTEFNAFTNDKTDYYPEHLRAEIDEINAVTYPHINNGVYKAGYAKSQSAYEDVIGPMFEALDMLDEKLGHQRYLAGDQVTEADWRLFPTLIRFDAAYVGAFKCNLRMIRDYRNLSAYTRELYQMPGIAETVDIQAYKDGYYFKNPLRNPLGIVPLGPELSFDEPPGREAL